MSKSLLQIHVALGFKDAMIDWLLNLETAVVFDVQMIEVYGLQLHSLMERINGYSAKAQFSIVMDTQSLEGIANMLNQDFANEDMTYRVLDLLDSNIFAG